MMRHIIFPLVLSIAAISPAAAQNTARAATVRLLQPLAIPAALRAGLTDAVARAMAGAELRYQGGSYSIMGCDDTEMAARLVDLNGDATPELHIEAGGTCVGGMAGTYNYLFIRNAAGAWNLNMELNGQLLPLPTRAGGFVDVVVGGPGFCSPVWRWNGREYALFCISRQGSTSCDRPACPRTIDASRFGQQLPAFAAGRA